MKYFILLLIGMLSISSAIGQQNTFSRVLYQSSKDIEGYASIPSYDNGYLVVGSLDWEKGLFVKVNSEGVPEWNHILSATETPYISLTFNNVITTFDSSYLIIGNSYNLTLHKQMGACLKINRQGDTLWTRAIEGNNNLFLYSVCQTGDSGYVVTGNTHVWQNTSIDKLFVAKLSKNGALLWAKEYTSGNYYFGYSIKEINNSNLIVSGYSSGNDFSFLLKLTSEGNAVWAKQYHSDASYKRCAINDFLERNNGFTLLANIGSGSSLIFTDSTGNVSEYKGYSTMSSYEGNFKIHQTNDKGYVYVIGDRHGGGQLIKTDSAGNLSFSDMIFDGVIDVVETSGLEFFVTASGPIYGVKNKLDYLGEIGFIQVDSLGFAEECVYYQPIQFEHDTVICGAESFTAANEGSLTYISIIIDTMSILYRNGCVDIVGGVSENSSENMLKITPNPSSGIITVTLTVDESGTFIVYNNLGQQVIKQQLNRHQTNFDLSNQEAGIYFYKFIAGDKRVTTGKIIFSE